MTEQEIRNNAPEGASYSFILNKYCKVVKKSLWVWNGDMWKHHLYIKHPRQLIRLQIKPL